MPCPGGILVSIVSPPDEDKAKARDIARAHELSESGRTVGKIVLYAGAP